MGNNLDKFHVYYAERITCDSPFFCNLEDTKNRGIGNIAMFSAKQIKNIDWYLNNR